MIHLNVLTRFNQKIKVKIFDQFYDQNKVSPKYAIEHRYTVVVTIDAIPKYFKL